MRCERKTRIGFCCGMSIALTFLIMVALLSTATGCAFFQKTAPGSDPILVSAEQTDKTLFATVDTFLAIDDENRQVMRDQLPEIHQFAEQLRAKDDSGKTQVQRLFDELRDARQAYRATRGTSEATTLDDKLRQISALAGTARSFIIQYAQHTGKPLPQVMQRH